MTAIVVNRHDNAARGSMTRGAVELANAAGFFALNRAYSSGAIAIGTTTTKVQSVATITATVNGLFVSKAATDDLWTLSGTVVAAASFQKYLLLLNASGTASIQEGTQSLIDAAHVTWDNVSKVSSWAPFLTIANAGKFVAGYLTVATDATHTFTPGTTALGAAGITTTYFNGMEQSFLPLIGNEAGSLVGLSV